MKTQRAAARYLADVPAGESARVAGVEQGHALRMRLMAIGITPGTVVRMVMRNPVGPCIVAVRGARVALGRGMLRRIRVEAAS